MLTRTCARHRTRWRAQIRVPSWAIAQFGKTSWSVLISDVAFFGGGGASTSAVGDYARFLQLCNAQEGPWPLQWGVSELVPYGNVMQTVNATTGAVTVSPYTPPGGNALLLWRKKIMIAAMLFEAESNPGSISGINLNPNKHIFAYFTRTSSGTGNAASSYNFYDPIANGSPVFADPYWNGGHLNNIGGFPSMTTDAYFLHDRGVTLQDGNFGVPTF